MAGIHTGPRSIGKRRQIQKVDFSEEDLKRISENATTDNLTGKAIHEIGVEVSKIKSKEKAVDPFEEPDDAKEAYQIDETYGDMEFKDAALVDPEWEEDPVTFEPYIKPVNKIQSAMGPPLIEPNSFDERTPALLEPISSFSGYSGHVQTRTTQETLDPRVKGTPGFTPFNFITPNKRLQSDTPLDRLDPEMEQLSEGDPIYGVGDGKSLAFGINIGIKERNYARKVWEDQKKNTQDKFGDLMSIPEGENPNITSQLKGYGMEILNEYKDLRAKRMDMSDAEYTSKETELSSRAKNIKTFRNAILDQANTWVKNQDNASVSTPIASRDFYNTITSGQGSLNLEMIDGILTMTGQTQGGKDVSIPAYQVINGENVFRFNEKIDLYGDLLDPLTKDLEKYKTDKEINFGISKEMIPYEELEPRIDTYLKDFLKDRTSMQSVLGDGYGYTYEQQIQKEKEGINLRQVAADAIKDDIRKMLDPAYAQKDIQADPRQSARIAQERINLAERKEARSITEAEEKRKTVASGKSGRGSAREREAVEIQKQINNFPTPSPENIISDWGTIIDKTKYKVQEDTEGNYFITDLKDNPISKLDFNKPEDIANTFANIAGIKGKQKLPYSLPK